MKAALLHAPRTIAVGEIQEPVAGPRQVLIRPDFVGICGSDMTFYMGHRTVASYPHVLGHELVGRIETLGEGVTTLSVGQRVVVEPNYPCGSCSFCRSGRGNICPNKASAGVTLPGFFSELCVAPAEFTWPVGETIPDVDAVTIEPLAVAVHALKISNACLGETVAVLGCGATGLLLIQVAIAQGLRVIAHETSATKLAMAVELGAVAAPSGDVAEFWKREQVTKVFDCAGVPATVDLALTCAPRGSDIYLLGLANAEARFVPLRFVREGLSLHGSLIYDHPADFAKTIAMVQRGILRPSRIVSATVPLQHIDKAFELATSGGAAKVLVAIREGERP